MKEKQYNKSFNYCEKRLNKSDLMETDIVKNGLRKQEREAYILTRSLWRT